MVIGGGSGGSATARRAAQYGKKVLLVDRGVSKDAIATKYVYDKEEYIWPHVRELRDYRKSSRDVPAAHLTTFGAFLHAYSGVCNFNYKVRPDGRLCIFEINTRIGADLACDVPPPLLRSTSVAIARLSNC